MFIFIIFIFGGSSKPSFFFFVLFGLLWCTCYDPAESSLASRELWEELCTFEIFISFWLAAKISAAVVWYRGGRASGCQVSNSCLAWQREPPDFTKVKSFCRTESYSLVGGWYQDGVSPGRSRSKYGPYQKRSQVREGRVGRKGQMRFAKSWI